MSWKKILNAPLPGSVVVSSLSLLGVAFSIFMGSSTWVLFFGCVFMCGVIYIRGGLL